MFFKNNKKLRISASFLSIKDNIKDNIKVLNNTNIDYLHVDIMDKEFVDHESFSFDEIKEYTNGLNKPLDVHLMVLNPDKYINDYAQLKPVYITIHEEIDNILFFIDKIKSLNIKVGVSIKPSTNIEKLYPLLKDIDLILIMSVEPGLGGQIFQQESLKKVKKLRKKINKENLNIILSIDGGINDITAKTAKTAGIDMIVAGSFITNSNNYQEQITKLFKS